jgi:2-polyprenyl-3-methyl-5-hydroxy-6-metoxy-1,4-benzoquinol methylase
MNPPASDREYWEDRARRHGSRAAGYQDDAMNAYEDRLRRSAITRLVGKGQHRELLDAGCGSGRWSVFLARDGWVVTGVDISRELIRLATPATDVTYIASAIQDLELPDSRYNAWLSVTALQHITSPAEFDAALDNLGRMLQPGGMAAVLEYSPLVRVGSMPSYMRARTRRQWIDVMSSRGYVQRAESGVRFLGHGPYILAVRLCRRLGIAPAALDLLRSICWMLDLTLARTPLITRLADVRLLIFEKSR